MKTLQEYDFSFPSRIPKQKILRVYEPHFDSVPRRDAPHARELRLTWSDGEAWRIRLDEGFGFLRADGQKRFPFDASVEKQAEMLEQERDLIVKFRRPYPTMLYIAKD